MPIPLFNTVLLDISVWAVCVVALLVFARLPATHPATPYLIFHGWFVTGRGLAILNGAPTLFSWPGGDPVGGNEIARAVLLADAALVAMTGAWTRMESINLQVLFDCLHQVQVGFYGIEMTVDGELAPNMARKDSDARSKLDDIEVATKVPTYCANLGAFIRAKQELRLDLGSKTMTIDSQSSRRYSLAKNFADRDPDRLQFGHTSQADL